MRITPLIVLLAALLAGCAAPAVHSRAAAAPKPLTYTEQVAAFDAKLDKLLAKPAAVAPAHPVYNCQLAPDAFAHPVVTPINWAHPALYNDVPTPRPDGPDRWNSRKIPLDNLRAFARLCRDGGLVNTDRVKDYPVVAGAPVVLDWEGIDPVADVAIVAGYVRAFKAEAPGLRVSVNLNPAAHYPSLESWRDGLGADDLAKLEAGAKALRPVTDQLDFLVGSAYLFAREWLARDLAAYAACNDYVRAKFQKPLYVFVNPQWTAARADDWVEADGTGNRVMRALEPDAAKALIDLAARYDATVLWADRWELTRDVFLPLLVGQPR